VLTAIGRAAQRHAATVDPWTNVYGTARTVLALATAVTLLTTPTTSLFVPGAGAPEYPHCSTSLQAIGLFCTLSGHLELARWLAVALLLVVASGWRPRWTGLVHWWIAFSFVSNATVLDGGDSVCSILSLLLLPLALTDDRRWHWDARPSREPDERETLKRLVALVTLGVIRLQVAGIYFHAAIAKFGVPEWADGTILHYLVDDPNFGAAPWFAPFARALTASPFWLAMTTWSVLLVEWLLSAGLIASKQHRGALLALGVSFHFGIVLLHGLISFGLAMMAALVLFLRPPERVFAWLLDWRPLPMLTERLQSVAARFQRRTSPARSPAHGLHERITGR
jgi:antimicrobial peptide system SdpB family protein